MTFNSWNNDIKFEKSKIWGLKQAFGFLIFWFFSSVLLETISYIFKFKLLEKIGFDKATANSDFASAIFQLVYLVPVAFVYFNVFLQEIKTFWINFWPISLQKLGLGIFIGTIPILLGFWLLIFLQQIQIVDFEINWNKIGWYLFALLCVGINEEWLCRGILLFILLKSFNPVWALILSSGLFALLHIFNNAIDLIPFINLFLAGIFLGISYVYERSLWFPIGLHWAWNFVQGPICGFEVSGHKIESVYNLTSFNSNPILTGGAFGLEGSIIVTVLLILFIIGLIKYYPKEKEIQNAIIF